MSPAPVPGRRRGAGFTLLEVLVALAVLAISLGAVIRLAGSSSTTVSYLRDRTLAGWVASNTMDELLLARAWPAPGSRQGRMQMARRDWYWQLTVATTDDPDLRRLEVAVAAGEGDAPLTRLVAFIGRPVQ